MVAVKNRLWQHYRLLKRCLSSVQDQPLLQQEHKTTQICKQTIMATCLGSHRNKPQHLYMPQRSYVAIQLRWLVVTDVVSREQLQRGQATDSAT